MECILFQSKFCPLIKYDKKNLNLLLSDLKKKSGKELIIYRPKILIQKFSKNKLKFREHYLLGDYLFFYHQDFKDKSAIEKLTKTKSKVSCHYYIDQKGQIIQMVPDLYVAWHAGKSFWKKDKNLNQNSIGIEISNPGHDHKYKKFSKKDL